MAFLFDSLVDVLAALLLFAACVSAWILAAPSRAPSRVNLRFAALLFAALAVARLLGLLFSNYAGLAPVVALIAASLGTTALALGLFAFLARPLPSIAAALALVLALGAGLGAALSGAPAYALGCQILAVSLTMAAASGVLASGTPVSGMPRALLSLLASLSLLCGGFALMDGAINIALLFFAAGLLGGARASQFGVEAQGKRPRFAAIAGRG